MKYVLLIHHGTSLDGFDDLPDEEKREVYAAWKALNETPGVTPGLHMQPADAATTVRVEDGRTLVTDGPFAETKDAIGGWCVYEARRPRRGHRGRRPDPGGAAGRRRRGAPGRGVVTELEQAFRDHWGRVLAALVGLLGDVDLAEEAAQEAFAVAAARWPRDGVPGRPADWLVATARNRAIDRIRRDRTLAAKTRLLEVPGPVTDPDPLDPPVFPDERLELLFTCCHPALAPKHRSPSPSAPSAG